MRRMYSKEQLLNMIENKYNLFIIPFDEEDPEVLQIGMPIAYIDVLGDTILNGGVFLQGEQVEFVTDTIYFNNLPTEDPQVVGQLWNDNGTLKISAGE